MLYTIKCSKCLQDIVLYTKSELSDINLLYNKIYEFHISKQLFYFTIYDKTKFTDFHIINNKNCEGFLYEEEWQII